MKILVLTSTFPRFAGDMQANFVGEQAEAWQAASPLDEVTILAPHHAGARLFEVISRLRVERFRYLPESWQRLAYPAIMPNIRRNPLLALQLPFFLLGQYRAARRIVRQRKVDVVYAHWVMPQGLVAWALKRSLGVPYVLQNHSSDLSVFLKLGPIGRVLARAILRDSTHFFCVNTAQKELALALFAESERGPFAKRCTVLPMGIAASAEVVAADRKFDIGTIARLSKKKGLNYLIEAAEELARQGIRPSIAIAGDGEDRAELEAMVENADITFPGFLTGAKKDGFLAGVDRFVFPSRAYRGDVEGLPVALLEALCVGRPVLASRDTNIELLPEWPAIRDAVTFVEDPADIPALVNALRQLLGTGKQEAQATAEVMAQYRWEVLIAKYQAKVRAALDAA